VSNERKTSRTFGDGIPSVPGRYGSFTLARQVERVEFWTSLALVGRRWGDPQNTFQAPGYGRIDLGGRYRLGPDTDVQVAVRNLGDVRYVDYLDATSNVYQGDRRNLTLTLVQRL
jgi:outer membrane receptor protein involved in Fe transport